MATHSSALVWRIPGTGEPGGLPSMGSHRVGHDCSDLQQQQQGAKQIPGLCVMCSVPGYYDVKHDILLPAAAAESLQSCRTLCNPIDGSPPGSPIPGIL